MEKQHKKLSSGEFVGNRKFNKDLCDAIKEKKEEEEEKEIWKRDLLLQRFEQMQREHYKKMKFNAILAIMAVVFYFLILLVLLLKYC